MAQWEMPLKVKGERVWRTWPGGRELDRLHGVVPPRDGFFPEEWMLSTTRARNVGREEVEEGICYLAGSDERASLKQLLERHPREMLGERHAGKYGSETGILVKLIDAQARLQLQAHPDKPTEKRLFQSEYGKTECWHILGLRSDSEEEPCLYLGFRPGIEKAAWRECFLRQDSDGMLSMLNRIVPETGQTFIVHGGVPHAIGGGCFLMEIQEPTDLTIRLEKKMPYGPELSDAACHQGLGFERMFDCFTYEGKSTAEAIDAWRIESRLIAETDAYRIERLVGYEVTECFWMERITISGNMPFPPGDTFSGLYVRKGSGRLHMPDTVLELLPNDQVFIPALCKGFAIESNRGESMHLLRFGGPKIL